MQSGEVESVGTCVVLVIVTTAMAAESSLFTNNADSFFTYCKGIYYFTQFPAMTKPSEYAYNSLYMGT